MLASREGAAPPMPLPELLDSNNPRLAGIDVSGMQLDSRKVQPGDLFLAMPGEMHDGRQFIEQAVASGAAAVLAEAPVSGFVDEVSVPIVEVPELRIEAGFIAAKLHGHPSQDMHVVGTTGTNGKTTTSRLIGQLARDLGTPCGVIGTLGCSLTDEVTTSANTTPDPLSLQWQLAQWRQQGVLSVGMEVSSHALVQGRVNGVQFETAIYTNLSHDHLDYHGTMGAYSRAKLRLFASEGLKNALINLDDDFAPLVAAAVPAGVQILTYSASGAAADIRIEKAQFHAGGVRGELHSPWGSAQFSSPLPGAFNLANLAAAVSSLVLAGQDLQSVLAAVGGLRQVPGRMQSIPNNQQLQVVVDYAHTPDALEQVLQALRPHVEGSLITVFGCGGDRDRAKRQLMARAACTLSDRVVVTSDNPRNEEPLQIIADIESGCSGDYLVLADRAEAIAYAVAEAAATDCILIAGKGHEDYQLIDGERLYFSDVDQARDALTRRAQL
ncbi:MAG: UDP-N-acetylmuramoyl-L-alanyl-D-glutamate--2,6-diaminopimelate ligase [Halioglobus sp.]|jgi:UDP-N-acetylmuramoyl-L-alanyl-D-glutamate--2,6-diaminopimelate ligase